MRKIAGTFINPKPDPSSKFGLNPRHLDERKDIRDDIYASAFADVLSGLETALSRADGDIVTRDSLQEWLGAKIVNELIRRRGV